MELREFTKEGVEKFQLELNEIRRNERSSISNELITSKAYCSILDKEVHLEKKILDQKKDLINYIFPLINPLDLENLNRRVGLWSWLAAFFFDSICPADKDGKRKVNDTPLYLLSVDEWGRLYRHLIASPYFMKKELGDLSKFYLVGKSSVHGEHFEQLAAQQEYATSKGIIEAAVKLYWDESKDDLKTGARGKDSSKGVVRRFTAVLKQLDLTYDLNAMNGDRIIEHLPKEFDQWLN